MFKNLRIKNFRLFDELQINQLSRINLLGGRNNSGKTTALEALFLLSGRGNPELVLRINAFRGIKEVQGSPAVIPTTVWRPLFSEFDVDSPIEIRGAHSPHGPLAMTIALERRHTISVTEPRAEGEVSEPWELQLSFSRGGKARVKGTARVTGGGVEIKTPRSPTLFSAILISSGSGSQKEDAGRLGRLRRQKQSELLTEALRVMEPRIRSVEELSASGVPMIWGDLGLRELVPLSSMGEGMTRVARLVLAISSAPGGLVLVDEIENGVHHSVMNKVWAVVAQAAQQFDTQVFATTHSFECLLAAHGALNSDDWRFHRLDRTQDGTSHCMTYDTEDVEAAANHGLEVR